MRTWLYAYQDPRRFLYHAHVLAHRGTAGADA